MKKINDVSVVIVSYNTKNLLAECIKSVYDETVEADLEVFVVDNASTDGSSQMVQDKFPKVKLIANKENRGFAKANNQAMELGSGRYVLLLNPDTLILENAIDKMIAFMDENQNVGLSTCKLLNADGTVQISSGMANVRVQKLFRSIGALQTLAPQKISWLRQPDLLGSMYRKSQEIRWLIGAFMLVRKEVVNEVGKLDENFFLYGEDNDWYTRIRKSGWKLWYVADADVLHYGGRSSSTVPSTQVVNWDVESNIYLLSKHSGPLRLMYWYGSTLLVSMALGSVFGLLSILPFGLAKSSYSREKYLHFKYKTRKVASCALGKRP